MPIENLIRDVKKSKGNPIVTSPDLNDDFSENNRQTKYKFEFMKILTSLLATKPGAMLYEPLNPSKFGCAPSHSDKNKIYGFKTLIEKLESNGYNALISGNENNGNSNMSIPAQFVEDTNDLFSKYIQQFFYWIKK